MAVADGAYEISNDPYFSSDRLSLLNRGVIFAIAHIRGGGEMGRQWYEGSRFLHKKNTFVDFVACAEYFVQKKYTSPSKLCIEVSTTEAARFGMHHAAACTDLSCHFLVVALSFRAARNSQDKQEELGLLSFACLVVRGRG